MGHGRDEDDEDDEDDDDHQVGDGDFAEQFGHNHHHHLQQQQQHQQQQQGRSEFDLWGDYFEDEVSYFFVSIVLHDLIFMFQPPNHSASFASDKIPNEAAVEESSVTIGGDSIDDADEIPPVNNCGGSFDFSGFADFDSFPFTDPTADATDNTEAKLDGSEAGVKEHDVNVDEFADFSAFSE